LGGVPGRGDVPGAEIPPDRREPGSEAGAAAVAHSILVIIYHLPKEQRTYREIVGDNQAA
jgi:hypothetical protein